MTRKDYVLIAGAIRRTAEKCSDPDAREALAILSLDLADGLRGTNPMFNRARFLAACEPQS